jgi:subtilase family serine protease
MRKPSGILLTVCLLAATPAFAGDLSFSSGVAAWHSTRCAKPVPPQASVLQANPETPGNDMNAIIVQRNAYADAMQAYMNCVSGEAENDQTVIVEAISSSAQREIDAASAEVARMSSPARRVR